MFISTIKLSHFTGRHISSFCCVDFLKCLHMTNDSCHAITDSKFYTDSTLMFESVFTINLIQSRLHPRNYQHKQSNELASPKLTVGGAPWDVVLSSWRHKAEGGHFCCRRVNNIPRSATCSLFLKLLTSLQTHRQSSRSSFARNLWVVAFCCTRQAEA